MEGNFEKVTFTHRENVLLTRLIEEQLKNLEKIKLEETFLSTTLYKKTNSVIEEMSNFYNRILTKVELLTDIDNPESNSDNEKY
jgi:hypothetical protein